MGCEKLYQKDVYLKDFETELAAIEPVGSSFRLGLVASAFFPTGGGQACDLGTIEWSNGAETVKFLVTDVYEENGEIWHVAQVAAPAAALPAQGAALTCHIDWERRFDNMQRHCGEHILSGIFHSQCGGVNRGFHMGAEYMTIDISLEDMPECKEISWETAMTVERKANQAIWADLPVITRHFDSREEAAALPLRKALALDEDITIVCVGDVNNPSDCVACCGTHPSTSGQVGLIKILRLESYKGMTRIYFEAGSRALSDYDKKHELLTKLNAKYSADTKDLLDKIAIQDEKTKQVRNELYTLKQSIIKSRVEIIRNDIEALKKSADPEEKKRFLIYEFDDMKTDDLLNLGRPLADTVERLLLIISACDNTLLLFSNGKIDCGKLVKENASIYNGKGGGNASGARALFPNREYLDTFIDLIEKHLR